MALTDTEARKARPTTKPYKLADSGGLFLAVMPAGGKLWRWKYRFEGREKLMALGSYPEVSLAEARNRHGDGRRLLAAGVDPMARRMASKTASQEQSGTTFEAVAALWMEHWKEGKSLRHVDYTRRRLETNILPHLNALQIAEIQAPDVVAMVRDVEARGARDVAKRALETTGQIFRYAIAHGHTTRNPAAEIKPRDVLKATVRENYARVDAKELPALLRQIEVYSGTHVTRLALKLMALTFVRTGELIGARWNEIDFEQKRWDIPAERMKMRTPHIVPLSDQAIEVTHAAHTHRLGRASLPRRPQPEEANEQQHYPQGTGADGLQGPHDRPRLPWPRVHHPARAGLRPPAHRTTACPRATERCERRLQPCAVPEAARGDDAEVGRLSGEHAARQQGAGFS